MTTGFYVGANDVRGAGVYHSAKADSVTWFYGKKCGSKKLTFVITLVFKRAPWVQDPDKAPDKFDPTIAKAIKPELNDLIDRPARWGKPADIWILGE